jgi:hypothetical protein
MALLADLIPGWPTNPPPGFASALQGSRAAVAGRGEKIVIEVMNANATAASIDWRIQLLDDMTFAPHSAASNVTHVLTVAI